MNSQKCQMISLHYRQIIYKQAKFQMKPCKSNNLPEKSNNKIKHTLILEGS